MALRPIAALEHRFRNDLEGDTGHVVVDWTDRTGLGGTPLGNQSLCGRDRRRSVLEDVRVPECRSRGLPLPAPIATVSDQDALPEQPAERASLDMRLRSEERRVGKEGSARVRA